MDAQSFSHSETRNAAPTLSVVPPAPDPAARGADQPPGPSAREIARRFALWRRSDAELVAEVTERGNDAARYQAQLATGAARDAEEAARLRGGVAYELGMIEVLLAEIAQREAARRFGYAGCRDPVPTDLRERFARMRDRGGEELADLIGQLTAQPGRRRGDRWRFACPFHGSGQERTPSLVVYPDGHAFCFACGWHGDACGFVAALQHLSPIEALRLLERGAL